MRQDRIFFSNNIIPLTEKKTETEVSDKIVIYRTADGQTAVDVRVEGETVWLSQAQMAEQRYTELKQLVAVLGRTVRAQEVLTSEDALDLVAVVSDYAYALDTLDKYDYQQLSVEQITHRVSPQCFFCGSWRGTEFFTIRTGRNVLLTIPLWPSR